MFANCMNQYLNSEYEGKKSGDGNDLIDLFTYYYKQIGAHGRARQLTVIRNCGLFAEAGFLHEHLGYFLENTRASLNFVYET